MSLNRVLITEGEVITAYGYGVERCWQGLQAHEIAVKDCERFETKHFQSKRAALIGTVKKDSNTSYVMQMLNELFDQREYDIPKDAYLFMTTTLGEIDLLEKEVASNDGDESLSNPLYLTQKIRKKLNLENDGVLLSSACASSNAAISHAASMIRAGEIDCAVVVACDAVSEFVFSGFSSLFALAKNEAAPFDQNREGLSLGEAAGFVVLMSEERGKKESCNVLGEVLGWGMSNDANHMTGPSRDGEGLARAIQICLDQAEMTVDAIDVISAHGTATEYNDAMEMKAYKSVFTISPLPVYSIKGAIGHSLAASGMVELLVGLKVLKEQTIPATLGLEETSPEAQGWVNKVMIKKEMQALLSTSSGFGGVNAALIIKGMQNAKSI